LIILPGKNEKLNQAKGEKASEQKLHGNSLKEDNIPKKERFPMLGKCNTNLFHEVLFHEFY
jgi:hypothetical protein